MPLTRIAAQSDLSPQRAGRGKSCASRSTLLIASKLEDIDSDHLKRCEMSELTTA